MSVAPLSSDVASPLAIGKLIEMVEKKEVGGGALNFQAMAESKKADEEKSMEEVRREKGEKPKVNLLGSGLEFSVDQETGRTIIKMYDRTSGKVVRQLPPEETLAFLKKLAEQDGRKGVLVSKKL